MNLKTLLNTQYELLQVLNITKDMFDRQPPIGEPCEECGEPIHLAGYSLYCENGCFEDDIRHFLSENYR